MKWITAPSVLRERGIMGMNRRNLGFVSRYNHRDAYPLVDNKLRTKRLAGKVVAEVERQLSTLPTRSTAAKSIAKNGAIEVTRSIDEAFEIANRFAPEHLWIPEESLLSKVQNAGSVFVGAWSPEAAGDYASGPNHVLPTGGAAALRGGLSVFDYLKIISVQQLEAAGLRRLAPSILTLARAEGLEAHARSIEVRLHA